MILIPTLGVPIGLLLAARAWAPKCARCDEVLLARVLGAAQRDVAMNEATAAPIVLESCAGCSAIVSAQLGGATGWFLDGNCGVVLNAVKRGS